MLRIIASSLAFLFLNSAPLVADELVLHQDFANYSVHYNVFNSTFIPAEIANLHKLKRSAYESLINVSVYKNDQPNATVPVKLSGSVRNLMQQVKPLEFIEIKETNAVYYLAPIRVNGEEILHFDFVASPIDSDETLTVTFSKKVFSD